MLNRFQDVHSGKLSLNMKIENQSQFSLLYNCSLLELSFIAVSYPKLRLTESEFFTREFP